MMPSREPVGLDQALDAEMQDVEREPLEKGDEHMEEVEEEPLEKGEEEWRPGKGRGVELVDVARRDNSGTEGDSEVEGVFCVTYSDS